MDALIRGLDQGIANAMDMRNALNVAEAHLGSINEMLLDVRTLVVQAQNPIMTDADRGRIQMQVDQLLGGIGQIALTSEFNTQNLLDGTFVNRHGAFNSDGSGMTISIHGATLAHLGLQNGIDVSDAASLQIIDQAMANVNFNRGNIGATINRIDHNINNNQIASINQAAARSRIMDADIPREVMRFQQAQLLERMQLFMQHNQMRQARQNLAFVGIMASSSFVPRW
jgi:flagellin